MHPELQAYYLQLEEPYKSTYLSLRDIILGFDEKITPEWKFKLPFFYRRGKMFCYLYKDKKTQMPYIGFMDGYLMEHPNLIQGNRKRMKAFYIDPQSDIDIESLHEILAQALLINDTKKAAVK